MSLNIILPTTPPVRRCHFGFVNRALRFNNIQPSIIDDNRGHDAPWYVYTLNMRSLLKPRSILFDNPSTARTASSVAAAGRVYSTHEPGTDLH